MKRLLLISLFSLPLLSVSGQSSPTVSPSTPSPPPTTTAQEYGNCPGDWIDADILGCYKFLDGKINHTWVEAQYECEQIGGYLAEPTNHRISSFLHSLANWDEDVSGIKYWFLGLTDLGIEGGWNWIHSKSLLTDENWGENKPNTKPGNTADCMVMVLKSDKYWWEDWDCMLAEIHHSPVAPVCQRDTDAFVTTAMPETTAANVCEAGWSEFDGSCYKYFSGNYYWIDAMATCATYESQLAIIHSKEEEDFLVTLSGAKDFWVGGSYINGKPVWMDGSTFDYGSFYSPDNHECMCYYNGYNQFNTQTCVSSSYYYSFICEK